MQMIETAASLEACLDYLIDCNIPAFVWGPPGVGKSQVVHQIARKKDMGLVDFRLSLRDPVDLRGLPLVDAKSGTTRWLPPSELPQAPRDGKRGILFLDEANIATQMMQGAAMGLVLDRKLGDYRLPEGWVPIAAGNRIEDRSAAQRLGKALGNRFAHITVLADVDAWCKWASVSGMPPIMIAFLRFRRELIHKMPQGDDNAFPSPRTWEMVGRIVLKNPPKDLRLRLIASIVGQGPAAELEGFIRVVESMPPLDQIIDNPSRASMPSEPSALYAVAAGLASVANKQNLLPIMTYASRMSKEYEVACISDAIRRDPSLLKTKAYISWAINNQEIV